jgi:streptogramin lyase
MTAALITVAVTAATTTAAAATTASPAGRATPPQSAFTAANGFAMMHGDPASSDTTPVAGPAGSVTATNHVVGAVCPSVLVGSDGMPIATCTEITTRKPTVMLLDPATGATLATLSLKASGSALGGVYTYLDQHNRVVMVDGNSDLLRIAHVRTATGWKLEVVSSTSLGSAIKQECGTATCDAVVGLVADRTGKVWFATQHGEVGVLQPSTGRIATLQLPKGEIVGNSISEQDDSLAVVTDHALYLLRLKNGAIQRLWRRSYDRGGPRKPGQLTDGSGTTPVFFGPHHASPYLAIVDNARPREHLLVYRLPHPRLICRTTVLRTDKDSGTEDAPIGYDRTVIVSDTYGFPYPAGTTGTASPARASFQGGMTRVDINKSGTGCTTKWDRAIRSAALPRLSLANHRIDTVISTPAASDETNVYGDTYSYATISERTGRIMTKDLLGSGPTDDTLQLVGTTTPSGVMYQGTLTGYLRIASSG